MKYSLMAIIIMVVIVWMAWNPENNPLKKPPLEAPKIDSPTPENLEQLTPEETQTSPPSIEPENPKKPSMANSRPVEPADIFIKTSSNTQTSRNTLLSKFSHIDQALESLVVSDLIERTEDYDTSNPITIRDGSDPASNLNGPLTARAYPDSKKLVVSFFFGGNSKDRKKLFSPDSCVIVDFESEPDTGVYIWSQSQFSVYRSKIHRDEFLIVAPPWYFQVVTASDKPDDRIRANLYKQDGEGKYPFVASLRFQNLTNDLPDVCRN